MYVRSNMYIYQSISVPLIYVFKGRVSLCNIETLDEANWEDDITVNLTAPFMFIKQFLGLMKQQGDRQYDCLIGLNRCFPG